MKKIFMQRVSGIVFSLGLLVSPVAFAHADVSVTVQSLSPGTSIVAGSPVSFAVIGSGFSGPSYGVTDSFAGSSISTANIDASGNFSWTPNASDTGTHILTLTVTDSQGYTGSAQEQITVAATASINIQNISPGTTVSAGSPLTFFLSAIGFLNPTYAVGDTAAGGSSVSSSNIDANGNFSWTPGAGELGLHSITVYAVDSAGHSATANIAVTVGSGTAAPVAVVAQSSLSAAQVQAILTLLQSFGADQSVINNVATSLGGQPVPSTAAPSGYVFTSYLEPGITSDEVTNLQTVLTTDGFFAGPITGYYGPITENAVIAFQAAHGIDQLGVVGPATRAALNQ